MAREEADILNLEARAMFFGVSAFWRYLEANSLCNIPLQFFDFSEAEINCSRFCCGERLFTLLGRDCVFTLLG